MIYTLFGYFKRLPTKVHIYCIFYTLQLLYNIMILVYIPYSIDYNSLYIWYETSGSKFESFILLQYQVLNKILIEHHVMFPWNIYHYTL